MIKREVQPARWSEPAHSLSHAVPLMAVGAGIGALVFTCTFAVVFGFWLVVVP